MPNLKYLAVQCAVGAIAAYQIIQGRVSYSLLPVVAYVVFSLLDGSEGSAKGRYWPSFQMGPIGKWCVGPQGFLPGRCVYEDEQELGKSKQCIFGAFPHGVVSFHHALMATDADGFISKFPHLSCDNRRDLAASVVFLIPMWREMLLWMGCVDASKETAKQVLRKGWSMYVLPGGEMEQLMTKDGEHHVYVQRRKGFVKLALEFGVDLVPCYGFGETDLYHTSSFLIDLRMWLCKNLRVAIPLAGGMGFLTMIPRRKPLHCVVGKPIKVTKSDKPSNAEVDALHAQFVTELKDLFDKHKAACGHADAELCVH